MSQAAGVRLSTDRLPYLALVGSTDRDTSRYRLLIVDADRRAVYDEILERYPRVIIARRADGSDFGEMLDATPEERVRYYALLVGLSLDERAAKVARLGRAVRELARTDIRRRHPEASSAQVEVELVARLYGRSIAAILTPRLAARERRDGLP